MVMDAQCNLLAGRDTQDAIDKEFHSSISAHGYRPRDKWTHEQFVSDTCDCRGAVVLDQSTFPVAELLFAANAHVSLGVQLPPDYFAVCAILCASDDIVGRACPMARVVAELLQGKKLIDDALKVCTDECPQDMVLAIEAHWNRARTLLDAETSRMVTASDRRLWKLWPIEAVSTAFIRSTKLLPR